MKNLYFLLFGLIFISLAGVSSVVYTQNSISKESDVRLLEQGKSIKREIKGGESHLYQINLAAGQFAQVLIKEHVDGLSVLVRNPDNKFLTENHGINPQGTKEIYLEAKTGGTYGFEIGSYAKPEVRGQYEIKVSELLTAEQNSARLKARLTTVEPVKKWLSTNALPLRTVETDDNFADLQPLKRILKNVQIVGMGEATHGTREFFQMKHRLFAFLVKEMGYTGFVMEADVTSCEEANEFVSNGKGDALSALKPLYGIWRTQEVVEMVNWMREYNKAASTAKKVKFLCFDMQNPSASFKGFQAYLQRVAPDKSANAEAILKTITETRNPVFNPDKEKAKVAFEQLRKVFSELQELTAFMTENKADFINKTSAEEYEKALQYLQLSMQGVDIAASSSVLEYSSKRDRNMAENVRYFIKREKPDTRFALWAHNGHILPGLNIGKNLGTLLRESFGQKYYAFGFSFGEGAFKAVDRAGNQQKFRDFTVGKGAEYSLDWYLSLPEKGNYIIDFRHTPKPKAISDWTSQSLDARSADFAVSEEQLKRWTQSEALTPIKPGETCDGIIFIDRTTGVRRN